MRVFVAGHRGMVGSAVLRLLQDLHRHEIHLITKGLLDLRNSEEVVRYLSESRIEAVVDAAAVVGGIHANSTYPFKFIMDNLMIQNSLINGSVLAGVRRFVFLGSSCIYPKMAPQPLREDSLLTGPLEPTNEWYAVAKIAGVKAVEAARRQHGCQYVSLMPTNLYGPGDNFDLETSHVLPAMIRKVHEAKITGIPPKMWGSGNPYREFLHVDDAARAIVMMLETDPAESLYNVGTGEDLSIRDLVKEVSEVVGYRGQVLWDPSKPDGTPRKRLDITKITSLGWSPKVPLRDGLESTYRWFVENEKNTRKVKI